MNKRSQEGTITLEACVSVFAFLILMLLLSGLFLMFMAQNVTGHAILQTSQSLSFDSYTTDHMKTDKDANPGVGSVGQALGDFVTGLFGNPDNNPYFVTDDAWYATVDKDISSVLKKRFVGYLAGGDEDKADEYLENMNIKDGLDGLDFSKSYVKDDTLYIVLNYELEYYFTIGDLGNVAVEQTTSSKLWK